MKKSILASIVIATAMFAGSASAITVDQVTSSANVRINVENGVATIFGTVDDHSEKVLLSQAAAKIDGVDSVRNLVLATK